MAVNTAITLVGVDWGTTHRRAYGLDANGHCIAEHADGEGALACQGRFAESLHTLLHPLRARPRAVVLSGMVGSALGWQLVPYVDAEVPLAALGARLAAAPGPADTDTDTDTGGGMDVAIVPGYCVRSATGQPDVMRGEETQLLGAHCLGHGDGWYVLPGTHSKWVQLRGGAVQQLRTYMTGELFDLLGRHGTLAAAAGTAPAAWDAGAFAQGVQAAQASLAVPGGSALSHQLFGVRARVVAGDLAASSSRSYLSGLLIGAELQDVLQGELPGAPAGERGQGGVVASTATATIKLIGSPALASHYQAAAAVWGAQAGGLQFELLDARAAFIAAVHHLFLTRKTA